MRHGHIASRAPRSICAPKWGRRARIQAGARGCASGEAEELFDGGRDCERCDRGLAFGVADLMAHAGWLAVLVASDDAAEGAGFASTALLPHASDHLA